MTAPATGQVLTAEILSTPDCHGTYVGAGERDLQKRVAVIHAQLQTEPRAPQGRNRVCESPTWTGLQGGLLGGGDSETVMKRASKGLPCARRGEGVFQMREEQLEKTKQREGSLMSKSGCERARVAFHGLCRGRCGSSREGSVQTRADCVWKGQQAHPPGPCRLW